MSDEVYLDKIRLGAVIVEKDLIVNNYFHRVINDVRQEFISQKDLHIYPPYNWCWQNVAEHYATLENGGYLDKIEKKSKERIRKIIEGYRNLQVVSLDDLRDCVSIIWKIMEANKFYDIVRKGEKNKGLGKITKRYRLKENDEEETKDQE